MNRFAVVMLNWNGEDDSLNCLESLKKQTQKHKVIAVDNGSIDNFCAKAKNKFPNVVLIKNKKNKGFAGGVNTGIRHAVDRGFDFVALINNDANPEKDWLEELAKPILNGKVGIVTGKLLKTNGKIDSTGDFYTSWGLPYPRGRDIEDTRQFDKQEEVFGASGGASLYRVDMLKEIGLFDEDFFAYYEDVDISFRAQLAGWKVIYTPKAIAHHKVGATSRKIPGFATYHSIKNLPLLYLKNVPLRLMPGIWFRLTIAHSAIVFSALSKGKIIPVLKGCVMMFLLTPKKLFERFKIQRNKKVKTDYIRSIILYDLPPNAHKLMKINSILRSFRFWKQT